MQRANIFHSYDTLYKCHFKGEKDMLAIYLNNNSNSKIFNGKGIILGGLRRLILIILMGIYQSCDNFPFGLIHIVFQIIEQQAERLERKT